MSETTNLQKTIKLSSKYSKVFDHLKNEGCAVYCDIFFCQFVIMESIFENRLLSFSKWHVNDFDKDFKYDSVHLNKYNPTKKFLSKKTKSK